MKCQDQETLAKEIQLNQCYWWHTSSGSQTQVLSWSWGTSSSTSCLSITQRYHRAVRIPSIKIRKYLQEKINETQQKQHFKLLTEGTLSLFKKERKSTLTVCVWTVATFAIWWSAAAATNSRPAATETWKWKQANNLYFKEKKHCPLLAYIRFGVRSEETVVLFYLLNCNDAAQENRVIKMPDAAVSITNSFHGDKTKTTGLSSPWIKDKVNISYLQTTKAHKCYKQFSPLNALKRTSESSIPFLLWRNDPPDLVLSPGETIRSRINCFQGSLHRLRHS